MTLVMPPKEIWHAEANSEKISSCVSADFDISCLILSYLLGKNKHVGLYIW